MFIAPMYIARKNQYQINHVIEVLSEYPYTKLFGNYSPFISLQNMPHVFFFKEKKVENKNIHNFNYFLHSTLFLLFIFHHVDQKKNWNRNP